jgi:enoyl-CoA hydratase
VRLDHYKYIKFEREGVILRVIIDHGEMSLVDGGLHDELSHVFYDVAADKESEVIILQSAGRVFMAGGDIKYMEELHSRPGEFSNTVREAKRVVFNLLDCDKPVICRIQGDAIGLGSTLALLCDIVVAEENARFSDPHVRVGLAAGDGGSMLWPQLVGYARAKYYVLTGDLIDAKRAEEIGLIAFAVPADELDAKVNSIAQKLAKGATQAIRATKATMNIGLKQLAHSMMDAGMAHEGLSNATSDHGEAVAAFREKRKPVFSKA